jgi:ABC-type branched-subunit amino acid transport system substrate-binding protein
MGFKRLRRGGALLALAALVAAGCTAGDDSTSGDDDAGGDTTPATTEPAATGPSPGVTDDAIKVGVTYVDTAALVASGLSYDLGDHEAVYNALFDAINADGGINGRQIEPVFAPIDPTNPAPAEEKCVQLTEDEDVFIVTGFFLEDAVNCVVGTHATAVVGGSMTPDRLDAAQAPWATWTPDTDQPEAVVQALFDQGELDGTVAVYAAQRDQESAEEHVVATLDDLGVEVTETGIMDAPADDQAAVQSSVQTIAQRFEADGVDTVVLVGSSAQDWPTAMAANTDYRPKLLFMDTIGARAFYTNAATTDTSVLEGSLAGGQYGPDQARFDEEAMQACIQILSDAGLDPETVPPDEAGDDPSNQPFQAAFQACPDVDILHSWLDAAGEDLNYGTLAGALDGLEVHVSGDPEPRTFGPPPDADGSPVAYLFAWDEDAQEYAPVDG